MSGATPGSYWDDEAIVPAKLSFLTLYNPCLGPTDDTLHDQLVYYYSSKSSKRRGSLKGLNEASASQEHDEQNERLRQIGLAQGMVEFAKLDPIHMRINKGLNLRAGRFLMGRVWTR